MELLLKKAAVLNLGAAAVEEEERKYCFCPRDSGLLWLFALQGFTEAIFKAPEGLLHEINGFLGAGPCADGLCGRRAGGPGVGWAAQVGSVRPLGTTGARRALGGRARGLGWLLTAVRLTNDRVSEPFCRGSVPVSLCPCAGRGRGCGAGLGSAGLRPPGGLGCAGSGRGASVCGAGCELAAACSPLCRRVSKTKRNLKRAHNSVPGGNLQHCDGEGLNSELCYGVIFYVF